MFRNYFLIALRSIRKNRGHAIINVLGLALGIILRVFRYNATANVDEVSQLKW